MPNWCFSYAEVTASDTDTLKKIYETIDDARTTPAIEKSDFGSDWMGNILSHFGIDWNTIGCRGSITDAVFDNKQNAIDLWSETAWDLTPLLNTIDAILQKEQLEAKVLWYGEEEGCEYYLTNDPTYKICDGKYHLIFNFNDIEFSSGYDTIEDALKKATELAHKPIASIDDLNTFADEAYEQNEDSEIKLIEFELLRD